jgi:hypothetical protein
MLGQLSLARVNRLASLGILPIMVLAITFFSRLTTSAHPAEPPTNGTLVVANLRTESLTFIHLETGAREELLLPGPPHEMLEAEGRIYVTLGRGNLLVEVDPAAHAMLRTVRLEGEPHGLAFLGGNLYVTLDKANELVVLDRASLTELRRIETGSTPHVIAASDASIIVTDSRDDALRQVEPSEIRTPTGAQPEGIAIVGSHVVTADAEGGSGTVAEAGGLQHAVTIDVGPAPIRVLPLDGTNALVALQGKGEVAILDVIKQRVTERISVGSRPDGLCLAPGSDYLAVASNAEGTVDLLSTASWDKAPALSLAVGLGSCLWLSER